MYTQGHMSLWDYHQQCLIAYDNKYNRVKNENNNKTEIKTQKRGTFNLYVKFLKSIFDSGTAISLSEIRDLRNDKDKINIVNSEVMTLQGPDPGSGPVGLVPPLKINWTFKDLMTT